MSGHVYSSVFMMVSLYMCICCGSVILLSVLTGQSFFIPVLFLIFIHSRNAACVSTSSYFNKNLITKKGKKLIN